MSVLKSNILTITEPTIELDTFDIPDVETGNTGSGDPDRNKKNNPNTSKIAGGAYPAIRINEYDFNQNDIKFFRLTLDGFLPQLSVSVSDSKGIFNLSQYPKDGDVLSLYIRSADETVYKPIRMDFDIISVDSPVRSNVSHASPRDNESNPAIGIVVYSFECRTKVPNLFKEECVGYSENTSFNHFEEIATELQLGFASNIDDTEDSMTRVCAFDTKYKFFNDTIKTAYKTDNNFFTSYIDNYYYLNFVDINNQFSFDENLEDTLISLINDMNDSPRYTEDESIGEGKLFLTNLEKGSTGTDRYIKGYALKNSSAEITLLNGYKRTIQYWDEETKEYREFTIDPLTTENLPEDQFPLRGRNDEDRYENEIKYYFAGKQDSYISDGNMHDNYLYAQILNYQNMQEINKLSLVVDLPKANMGLYRFQRIPVIMYETDQKRTETLKQRKAKNEDEGNPPKDDKGKEGDSTTEMYGAPIVNNFLTGIYVIGKIEYIYSRGEANIKQRLTLLRREWTNPI